MPLSANVLETGDLKKDDIQELLNQRLLPERWPGAEITNLEVDRQRFTPGKECTASGSFQIAAQAAGSETKRFIVSYVRQKTLGKMRRHQRRETLRSNPAVLDLDEGLLIEVFPEDWRLPGLPLALDPDRAGKALAGIRPPNASRLDLRLLRYRPHMRALLAYTFRDESGEPLLEAIGKVYGDDSKFEASSLGLASLAAQGGDSPITPVPLLSAPDWRLVVMEKVDGAPLFPILLNAPQSEAERAIRFTARSLFQFHRFELEREEKRSLSDELVEIRDQAEKFGGLAGWLRDSALQLAEKGEAAGRALQPRRSYLVHGAFKAEQLLILEADAVIVDLDGSAEGDAALDIGNFAAKQFKEAAASERAHLHATGQALAQAYLELDDDPTLAARIKLYEATSLTLLAFRELHTVRRDLINLGQESPSARLMARAESLMAEVESA